jgi:hypothetical protein
MSLAITPGSIRVDSVGALCYIFAKLTVTNTVTYPTNGEVFDPSVLFTQYKCAPKLPYQISVSGVNGYSFGYVAGATLATGKLKVTTASNTELSAGAYPAGITGDTGINIAVVCAKA